jgi:hypothetical protein
MEYFDIKAVLEKKPERFLSFLIHILYKNSLVSECEPVTKSEMVSACMFAIKKDKKNNHPSNKDITEKYIAEKYIKQCNDSLTPLSSFKWLNKRDIRQCNFVWSYLGLDKRVWSTRVLRDLKNDEIKYSRIVMYIDELKCKIREKIELMDRASLAWDKAIDYKGSDFLWLKPANKRMCSNALRFLSSPLLSDAKEYQKPPHYKSPRTSSDYYEFLLSVDLWQAPSSTKKTFRDRIKDAERKWVNPSQKPKKTSKTPSPSRS